MFGSGFIFNNYFLGYIPSFQDIDYTYNIRGWLKGINDVNNLGTDLFGFKLNYNTKEIGSANALQYNGNISETIWRTTNDVSTNKTRAYAYQYDALSRITGADYGIKTTGSYNLASGFDMGVGLYDKNGNIKSLWRDNMANTKIDQLSYTYANAEVSNKLLKVEDSSGSTEGFKNGSTLATEYTYDGNGNMLRDYNKGITTNIIYNHLNLPSQITFASGKIEYFYDAVGTKQKKKVTNGTVITTTDYAGKFVYQNNALQFISQPEGYLEPNGQGGYDYGYRLKDHLGNIRLTFIDFDHNGSIALSEITEENNYYPFGLKHQGYNFVVNSNVNAVATKFKYNSKELNDELGLDLYDYGARMYDPALGRFTTIDPLAEKYNFQSPYLYAYNNPIRYTDYLGMGAEDEVEKHYTTSSKTTYKVNDDGSQTVKTVQTNFVQSSQELENGDIEFTYEKVTTTSEYTVSASTDENGEIQLEESSTQTVSSEKRVVTRDAETGKYTVDKVTPNISGVDGTNNVALDKQETLVQHYGQQLKDGLKSNVNFTGMGWKVNNTQAAVGGLLSLSSKLSYGVTIGAAVGGVYRAAVEKKNFKGKSITINEEVRSFKR